MRRQGIHGEEGAAYDIERNTRAGTDGFVAW